MPDDVEPDEVEPKDQEARDASTVALLREIRDVQQKMLDTQTRFLWVLLPIFALLTILTILGLAGFFGP